MAGTRESVPLGWTGENLTFRFLEEGDLDEICRMLAKDSVCEWLFFGPNTEEVTMGYFMPLAEGIEEALGCGALPENPVFTLRTKEDGRFVGQCALLGIDFSPGAYLVGYQIDEPHWNRGYGTEACEFLVCYAFLVAGAYRLNGDCAAGHAGSRRVMEKCGFAAEGCQRKYWHARGGFHDRLLFGLLADDLDPSRLLALASLFTTISG
jgi:ribosomal-protein-alanine N-acetyltransferase